MCAPYFHTLVAAAAAVELSTQLIFRHSVFFRRDDIFWHTFYVYWAKNLPEAMKRRTAIVVITVGLLMSGFSDFGPEAALGMTQKKEISYTQIEVGEISDTVKEAIKEYFTDYVTDKAYLGDDGSYKLEVSKEDIQYILYYKDDGELIKVEQPEPAAQD